jgi:hypothetical protein
MVIPCVCVVFVVPLGTDVRICHRQCRAHEVPYVSPKRVVAPYMQYELEYGARHGWDSRVAAT